jgi:hypothetical protein
VLVMNQFPVPSCRFSFAALRSSKDPGVRATSWACQDDCLTLDRQTPHVCCLFWA